MQSAGAGNLRLARQGKRDARLSLAFDDQFKSRFNTGGGRNAADVRCETVWWFCMVVLYVKMRAKGTCGVRTRDRSQFDAVPFAGLSTFGLFMNRCTGF